MTETIGQIIGFVAMAIIVFSYQQKVIKPNRKIFETLLNKYHLKAEECVFIDDGPANVESAKRVGMQGLLVEKDSDWWDKLSEILNE